ncbi:ferredoxin [Nocardioides pantholopis]|uniref:ferredoxin n=1 Tax=Nocardioides pantholopis TaxID=2483798 RepID=UPI000FDB7641|nr:ferredoxin [Nocardioides pantholopis]
MKIVVDYDKCTGLGMCESLSPDHFEVNDEGDLVLLKDGVSAEERQGVDEAVAACPTEALRLLEG